MTVFVPPCNLTAEIHDNPPFIFLNIAFSAINCIANHYESTCEDSKKSGQIFPLAPPSSENLGPKIVNFQFFKARAFRIAFTAINCIASHYEIICEDSPPLPPPPPHYVLP